ncbi:hypothetical protein V8G54_031683 [Vigna mungo]|uniref:J domain-containing protein n=1 Tax=Vigna mungo TaxID=3915 RepID=A0AAQ3MKL5_VIGMU
MDVLRFNSNLSTTHMLPLSKKHQTQPPRIKFSVSCRATKQQACVEENLYKVLSLSPMNATTDDIKKAYRSMALQYHPDVCHDGSKKEELTRMFVQLNAAYTTLSNPQLRADYDYELGLRSKKSVGDESWRCTWQDQVAELKRRSHTRMAQRNGSWGSRVRARNMN